MRRLYLIYEVNCYIAQPTLADRAKMALRLIDSAPVADFGSVWIAGGSYDPDNDDYETCAFKLIGPVPGDEATRYLERLRSILEAAGVEIVQETVADD